MRNGASGASLAVQWLRLRASNADCVGSIPGQGTKIPHATWHSQRKKKERERKEKGGKKQTLMTCPNPTVLTAILQVNRKNKGCVCVCVSPQRQRERFTKLAHVIVGTNKPEIHMATGLET